MQKNQFLRVQNSLLKLQDFMKLKEREWKDWEVKIKREIEELFLIDYCVCRWYG